MGIIKSKCNCPDGIVNISSGSGSSGGSSGSSGGSSGSSGSGGGVGVGGGGAVSISTVKAKKEYQNLIFEGGSTKGIAYAGAILELERLGILSRVTRFAGSSAGAITAMLLAIGYSAQEFYEISMKTDYSKFIDDKVGIIRDSLNFIEDFGYCQGTYIYKYIEELIQQKTQNPDYTFKQLYDDRGVELVITGTNITDRKSVYYHHHNYPNMRIKDAVRISISIPFLFEPIIVDGKFMVDGGVIDNYPIHLFDGNCIGDLNARLNLCDPNPYTLGLKLITPDEVENIENMSSVEIKSIKDYAMSIIETLLAVTDKRYMRPGYWERTLPIHVPNIPATQFKISPEQQQQLIDIGKKSVVDFFNI